ncbi:MAG TPA: hypothetical protein VMS73_10445 [Anaerolineaceae bacterium]|nr:hypothetical protein [Anaerolineaceae bacterium]
MLEMQILVGPAAAVGGEPYSVGKIPFTVSDQDPYTMQGKTHLSYNTTLDYSWGTYTVTLEMDADLTGQCVVGEGGNSLNMEVKLSGEQNLVVVVHLKQTTYPWKGSSTLQLTFPIQEGATAKGEGWIFVLHINES